MRNSPTENSPTESRPTENGPAERRGGGATVREYLKIARIDHWIKQLFVLPGMAFALFLAPEPGELLPILLRLAAAFFATSAVASANYVINEWLDAAFDRYHPVKKNRPVVSGRLKTGWILLEYALFAAAGLVLAAAGLGVGVLFYLELWLLLMGVLYNVRPFRTKDVPYLDVLSESVNNAIRLLIGWFSVTSLYYPPVSIVLGYWMGGAFLMAMKRFSEYRMIGDPERAALYRRSFRYYTERSLLASSFFYGLLSVFFCGIFMIKYRIELVLDIPLLCGLFCYYLVISYKEDSSVQRPEKLFREKGLMVYLLVLIAVTALLLFVDIPVLNWLLGKDLIDL